MISSTYPMMSFHLVSHSLSEMGVGGLENWEVEWEAQRGSQYPLGQLWFLSWKLSPFPRAWHLPNHCSFRPGPHAQWQPERHPLLLTGIKTGALLSHSKRDLPIQSLWLLISQDAVCFWGKVSCPREIEVFKSISVSTRWHWKSQRQGSHATGDSFWQRPSSGDFSSPTCYSWLYKQKKI